MTKYVLREIAEGREVRTEETFKTFEDLKAYLIENTDDLFGWINDNVDDPNGYRVLPRFEDVETVREIKAILDEYDYSWWSMTIEEVNVFTNLLRQKRLEQGLTQVQVSEALGFNSKYYQQIELGNKLPSYKTWLLLASLLNIDLGELKTSKIELTWTVSVKNYGDNDLAYLNRDGELQESLCDSVIFDNISDVLKAVKEAEEKYDVVTWSLFTDIS